MSKYIGDVIDTINYNAEFNYDFPVLPNPAPQNNANACRQYKNMIDAHINAVQKVWFQSMEVEASPQLVFWTDSGPSEGWGDYLEVDPDVVDHGSYDTDPIIPRALRDVAKEEFNVSDELLSDIDILIQTHDRSRYSEDEFYAAANYHFGTRNTRAYRISQLKHYQRNAHEFTHYVFHREDGPSYVMAYDENDWPVINYTSVIAEMPEAYVWCRIAVWLANFNAPSYVYNNNNGYNPFQYYWGADSNYKWVWIAGEGEEGGYWEKIIDTRYPSLLRHVEIPDRVQSIIETIVDRWSQIIPEPAPLDEEEET